MLTQATGSSGGRFRTCSLQVNGYAAEFFRRMAARLQAFIEAGFTPFVAIPIWGRVRLKSRESFIVRHRYPVVSVLIVVRHDRFPKPIVPAGPESGRRPR
jgi:hypothetical protein